MGLLKVNIRMLLSLIKMLFASENVENEHQQCDITNDNSIDETKNIEFMQNTVDNDLEQS